MRLGAFTAFLCAHTEGKEALATLTRDLRLGSLPPGTLQEASALRVLLV